jgi:predicted dienelactone hydrolase
MASLRHAARSFLLGVSVACAACSTGSVGSGGNAGSGGAGGDLGEPGPGGAGGTIGASVPAPDDLGPYAISYASFTPVDASRNDRPLPVSIWYPADPEDTEDGELVEYPLQSGFTIDSSVALGELPVSGDAPFGLLIFSHGFGGINTQSTKLMEALASHGFVVASVEHTGNTALDSSDPTPGANRVPDVTFVIDQMLARSNDEGDDLSGAIDPSRIGVLGHSFGGSTAMGSVVGWQGAAPDPRVGVIASIAGGVGTRNFTEEQLASVTTPTMLLVGTLDPSAMDNHREAFGLMPNAEALFMVEITGANHTHFANVCDIGNALLEIGLQKEDWPLLGAEALIQPYDDTCTDDVFPIEEASRLQNLYMVAHFKRYLDGEIGYDAYLTSDYAAANEPDVSFQSK